MKNSPKLARLGRPRLKKYNEWIVEQCRGKNVLDVGCVGYTDNPESINWLHGMLCKVAKFSLGIDIDGARVKRLHELGYNIICANAETFISHSRKFEVITACGILEHLNNVGLFLNCARKNLTDDGKLIIMVPNGSNPSVWLTNTDYEDHVFVFTPIHIERILKRYGFKVVEFTYFNASENSPINMRGKIFEKLVVPLFSKFAFTFGVIAKKVK